MKNCVIPELHVLQGFVNHFFWKELVPFVGQDKALLWPQKLKLFAKNYHGDSFEGNACRKLITCADNLNNAEIYEKFGYLGIHPYIVAFKTMNKIVECSFTFGKVGENLQQFLHELKGALQRIENVSTTLKIHVLLNHVTDCLKFIDHNNGLGFWSEQSGESVHREFLKIWDKYKINVIQDESFAE